MDPKFRIYFEGLPDDAIRSAEKVVTSLNKANDAQKRYSRERQQLARTERQERFRELSQEEQYQRLLQRREQLERRLAQARARGQGSRVDALELLAARNRSALRGYGPSVPPIIRGATVGSGGLIGALLAAGQGGGLGSTFAGLAGGVALGTVIGRIGMALASAAKNALRFSDEISDLADQSGLANRDILLIRQAAGSAGIGSGRVLSALSTLSANRSAALGGDADLIRAFGRFGVTPDVLGSGASPLDIARQIQGSIGSARVKASDRSDLGKIFGRNPEQIMGVAAAIPKLDPQSLSELEAATKKLGNAASALETFGVAFKNFVTMFVADMGDFFSTPFLQGLGAGAHSFAKDLGLSGVRWKWAEGIAKKALDSAGVKDDGSNALPVLKTPKADQSGSVVPTPLGASKGELFSAPSAALNLGPMAAASALGRIGLFRGAQDPDRVQIFRDQLRELIRIKVAQEATRETLERTLT